MNHKTLTKCINDSYFPATFGNGTGMQSAIREPVRGDADDSHLLVEMEWISQKHSQLNVNYKVDYVSILMVKRAVSQEIILLGLYGSGLSEEGETKN
jgi:hypothetical protein